MKILGIDTAMAACSAAVIDTELSSPLSRRFQAMERGHAEALAPMVEEVMADAGLSFADIDRIAVTVGPGTFTGVRIGLAMARGLGLALGIPVIGIDSLSAIAANETADVPILVASDARNGGVFAAYFDHQRKTVRAPHLTSVAGAAAELQTPAMVIGTGAELVTRAIEPGQIQRSSAGDLPNAEQVARLAANRPDGDMPAPLYLRAADAKPQAGTLRRAASLAFQPAAAQSAPLLAAIHAEAFDIPWTANAFGELLAMPGAAATIASEVDEPAAFILTRRAADEAEIITIATRPFAQRRGIGRSLAARQLAVLAQDGVRQVFLEVARSNAAGRGLYRALGFDEVGTRRDYYAQADGTRDDAIIMRRDISP